MAGQEGKSPLDDRPSDLLCREPSDSVDPDTNKDSEATPTNDSTPQDVPTPKPPSGRSECFGPFENPADTAAALREVEREEAETNDDKDDGMQAFQPRYPSLYTDSQNAMFSNPLPLSELKAQFGAGNIPAPTPQPQQATAPTPTPIQPVGLPLSMINHPTPTDPSLRRFAGYSEALGMARPIQDTARPRPFLGVGANERSQVQLNWDAHQIYFPGQNPHVELPHAAVTRAVPTRVPAPTRNRNPSFAQPMVPGQLARHAPENTLLPRDIGWETRHDNDIFFGQLMTRDNNPWQNLERMLQNRAAARAEAARAD